MSETAKDLWAMIAACEEGEESLMPWERGFVENVAARLLKDGALFESQIAKLREIWEQLP